MCLRSLPDSACHPCDPSSGGSVIVSQSRAVWVGWSSGGLCSELLFREASESSNSNESPGPWPWTSTLAPPIGLWFWSKSVAVITGEHVPGGTEEVAPESVNEVGNAW